MIVDILRASTTITFALDNGAAGVVPCETVEDARQIRSTGSVQSCLLGGERGGVRIDGFDLSNSPDDYDRATVAGRLIGFTTTNGTLALLRSAQAERIIVGAFVNLSAVVRDLLGRPHPIHIVCAGTNGFVTAEDVLLAGALVQRLCEAEDAEVEPSDAAEIARHHWLQRCRDGSSESVEAALRISHGGRNLIKLGYQNDIATAARIDAVSALGVRQPDGVIRLD